MGGPGGPGALFEGPCRQDPSAGLVGGEVRGRFTAEGRAGPLRALPSGHVSECPATANSEVGATHE